MNEQYVHQFVTEDKFLTDDEYRYWKKLTSNMTNAARMMGLSESKLTRRVFETALDNLTAFEVKHHLSFLSLEMTLSQINEQKGLRSSGLSVPAGMHNASCNQSIP